MSGFISTAIQQVENLLLQPPRAIGMIIPDCTIEEMHRDDLTITEHPVEQGASITDHAFKRPAEVVIRAGWSNSSSQAAFQSTLLGIPTFGILPSFSEDYVNQVYEALLQLQLSRQPFTIVTGKRLYQNMLIATLSTTTDRHSEYSLFVTAACKQIITVTTSTVLLPPTASMATPQSTAPTPNTGTTQAAPAPNESLLYQYSQTPSGQFLQKLGGEYP